MSAAAQDWQELAYAGQTVQAIKTCRATHDIRLDEAKAIVERWMSINMPPSVSFQECSRVAQRVADVLAEYKARTGRALSYVISILPPDPKDVIGQNTLFLAEMLVDRPQLDLVVEVEMAGVSGRLRKQVVMSHMDEGVRMIWTIESDGCSRFPDSLLAPIRLVFQGDLRSHTPPAKPIGLVNGRIELGKKRGMPYQIVL